MSQSLTLFDIEKALVELLDARDHPDMDDAGRAAVDLQIKDWTAAELTKCDNIRAFLRNADNMIAGHKEEAARQLQLAASWESQRDYLKGCIKGAMEAAGKTKVDGRTGSISLRTAGGKQAVEITSDSLLPDEFCMFTLTMPGAAWEALKMIQGAIQWIGRQDVKWERVPRKGLIEAELQKPCPMCAGEKEIVDMSTGEVTDCATCGGSGKQTVAGARLADRGTSVVVR